jgi:hypothetical protein
MMIIDQVVIKDIVHVHVLDHVDVVQDHVDVIVMNVNVV